MTTTSLSPKIVSILLGAALVMGIAEGFYSYRLTKGERNMEAVIGQRGADINKLNESLKQANDNYADLQGEMKFTKDRLGTTQVELHKSQQANTQLARQQKVATIQLNDQNEQIGQLQQQQTTAQGSIGTLSSDVEQVKTGLNSTNEQVNSARTDLQRVVGDLGVQSGLIARNHSEIDELRKLGERDYYEFSLAKIKQPQRIGTVALALKKTDPKRQRYTLNLISDDRTIEKKDKTVDEPVQFYQNGFRQPSEIVVNHITKDRIEGYLSVPKSAETRPTLSEAIPAAGSKPRS